MQKFYQFLIFCRHCLTATNTGGHGIHSPSLFYIVSLLNNNNALYYAWEAIEQQRNKLRNSTTSFFLIDAGSRVSRTVSLKSFAKRSLMSNRQARVLFVLTNYLTNIALRPLSILELGTACGITTAYLATPSSKNRVTTIEYDLNLCNIAQQVWKELKIRNIELIHDKIEGVLPQLVGQSRSFDLIFMDANHTKEALLTYWEQCKKVIHSRSVVVLHDIYFSKQMTEAWECIKSDSVVTATLDYFFFALVFFNSAYSKSNYRLFFYP